MKKFSTLLPIILLSSILTCFSCKSDDFKKELIQKVRQDKKNRF